MDESRAVEQQPRWPEWTRPRIAAAAVYLGAGIALAAWFLLKVPEPTNCGTVAEASGSGFLAGLRYAVPFGALGLPIIHIGRLRGRAWLVLCGAVLVAVGLVSGFFAFRDWVCPVLLD